MENLEDLGFEVGDRVVHVEDETWTGVVLSIDGNGNAFSIRWDESGDVDPQWTNRFQLLKKKLDFIGG